MALEGMITFSGRDKKPDLSAAKPPPPDSPTGSSQEELKGTQVAQELNSIPKTDMLTYLEN